MTYRSIAKSVVDFFKANWILISILFLSLAVRLYGNYPGLSENQPDEVLGYGTAIHMFYNHLVPNSFDYGAGRPFILLVIFQIFFLPVEYIKLLLTNSDLFLKFLFQGGAHSFPQYQDILFGHNLTNAMYWGRYVNSVIGVLTVLVVYLLAKNLFNRRVGLFAAFFLAFNFRHVLSSHIGVPDVFNSFFTVLSLYFSSLLLKKNSTKNYILAGLAAGVCISIKYQFFHLFPLVLAHLYWMFKTKRFFYFFDKKIFISAGVTIAVFFVLNPFLLLNLEQFTKESMGNYRRYAMGVIKFRPYSYFYLYHWGIGELISIASVLGIILLFLKEKLKLFFLLLFIAPFFFFLTVYSTGGIYTRNYASVIPLILIFVGYFFDKIYLFLNTRVFNERKIISGLIIALLVIVSNFPQMKDSMVLSYSYAQPFNSDLIVNWIKDYLPDSVTLRNYPLDLTSSKRDVFAETIKEKHVMQLDWKYLKGPHSLAEFQAEHTDFAILDDLQLQSITYWWMMWGNISSYLHYSGVPYEFIQNGFYGLSIKELMNYTVKEIYKPWQAVSAGNYLVFKIPPTIIDVGKVIKVFKFENRNSMWQVRGSLNFAPAKFGYVGNEGKENKGSLLMYGSGEGNASRLGSEAIPVLPNKTYVVRGWIKNYPKNLNIEKDGFIRIDFYKNNDNLDKLGMSVALSARAPISGEWTQVQATARAPQEAKYMTVSFQREIQAVDFVSYLDDVEVFESNNLPEEPFKELPYVKSTIPVEDLYINTFL